MDLHNHLPGSPPSIPQGLPRHCHGSARLAPRTSINTSTDLQHHIHGSASSVQLSHGADLYRHGSTPWTDPIGFRDHTAHCDRPASFQQHRSSGKYAAEDGNQKNSRYDEVRVCPIERILYIAGVPRFDYFTDRPLIVNKKKGMNANRDLSAPKKEQSSIQYRASMTTTEYGNPKQKANQCRSDQQLMYRSSNLREAEIARPPQNAACDRPPNASN